MEWGEVIVVRVYDVGVVIIVKVGSWDCSDDDRGLGFACFLFVCLIRFFFLVLFCWLL